MDRFKKLAVELYLAENGVCDEMTESSRRANDRRFFDMMSMMDDQLLQETDDGGGKRSSILDRINADDFETDPDAFLKSFSKSGKHGAFLSDYSAGDFQKMNTFRVRGFDAGFAIALGGDIVSVHNHTGVGRIGADLMKAAIRMGGKRLDHYDGFLTGFYKKLGFRPMSVSEWDDAYARPNWPYTPLDINNPESSVYAVEWKRGPAKDTPEWKEKASQYADGKPDVVYRKL